MPGLEKPRSRELGAQLGALESVPMFERLQNRRASMDPIEAESRGAAALRAAREQEERRRSMQFPDRAAR